jgi:hypothetical protein
MASWKKVIVSGSAGEFTSVTSSVLTNDNLVIAGAGGALENSGLTYNGTTLNLGSSQVQAAGFSGSFSGSFQGNGSGLTGVVATNPNSISQGTGIVPFSYNGLTAQTVAVSGAAQLSSNAITKWDSTDGKFVNSSLTDNGTTITGTTSIQLTGASSNLSGSFSGSFQGDGSGLTGVVSNLNFSGSTGNGTVALKTQAFTIAGTANEIETSAVNQTLTIGLPDDVIITQDLTVNRNLTVLGTASFQNTTNLDVADRFILLASGSNTGGDGGIVVQQGTQGIGEAFAFDLAAVRWGVTGSFDGSTSTIAPDAFMAAVVVGAGTDPNTAPARYDAAGNIFVGTDENIWIYS